MMFITKMRNLENGSGGNHHCYSKNGGKSKKYKNG